MKNGERMERGHMGCTMREARGYKEEGGHTFILNWGEEEKRKTCQDVWQWVGCDE